MLAMNEEMQSLQKNQTWNLVEKPTRYKTVECKWAFKKKENATKSEPIKFKARLMAKRFTQQFIIDYTKIFSLIVRHASIRMFLTIVAHDNLELE